MLGAVCLFKSYKFRADRWDRKEKKGFYGKHFIYYW